MEVRGNHAWNRVNWDKKATNNFEEGTDKTDDGNSAVDNLCDAVDKCRSGADSQVQVHGRTFRTDNHPAARGQCEDDRELAAAVDSLSKKDGLLLDLRRVS